MAARPLAKPRPTAPPQRDFETLLRTLDPRQAQPQGAVGPQAQPGPVAQTLPADAQPTATEIEAIAAAIKRQIERCWIPPVGAANAEDLTVRLAVSVERDGTVTRASVVSIGAGGNDDFRQAAADSARRAVLNPQCSKLDLPPNRYEVWKELALTFNLKELLGR
jgi:outer membrane biosynthesis protein TonB